MNSGRQDQDFAAKLDDFLIDTQEKTEENDPDGILGPIIKSYLNASRQNTTNMAYLARNKLQESLSEGTLSVDKKSIIFDTSMDSEIKLLKNKQLQSEENIDNIFSGRKKSDAI